jgi:2,4-dienoyl-CoA reductase-like NADH-dependent reductase (Old Yellow Enzyme family)
MSRSLAPLWEPFTIGDVRLRNRVFVSAHTTNFGRDNMPTERHVAYHRARAAGGVGLIVTEGIRVHPTSSARDSSLAGWSDDAIPHYRTLVDAVHAEGSALFAQVLHLGRQAAGGHSRSAAWAPSAVPWSTGAHVPHAMGRADIAAVTAAFAGAAQRLRRAGFDGLEVHLGHGHLLQQFLSPATNTREDAYGGTLDGRLRLAREVLTAVDGAVPGWPVGIRISASEFLPGGLDVDDMVEVVERLSAEFPLAFLHVSHSAYAGSFTLATQMADMSFPATPFRELPARFKATFPLLPVLAVCRIDDVETAASLLDEGAADLVGMTRAHIADPALLTKARDGRLDDVRSCVACNQGCIGRIEQNLPLSCVVNPEVGYEAEWEAWRSSAASQRGQRVLVVGGGVSGLQAALTLAGAGARVLLAEAGRTVGGQLAVAATATNRHRWQRLLDDLVRAVLAAGVEVRRGWTVDAADVRAGRFDAVVVATGSVARVRSLSGVTTVSAEQAVRGEVEDGPVAVYDETGDWIAAAAVETLATTGHRVHLVTPVAGVAWNVTTYARVALLERYGEAGVQVYPLRRPRSHDGNALVLEDTLTGDLHAVAGVRTLVHVGPRSARDDLFRALDGDADAPAAALVGDAYAPRSALEAIFDAQLTAARLLTGGPTLGLGDIDAH